MDTKEQFQKILEWMKEINRSVSSVKKEVSGIEGRLNERLDTLSEGLQVLLKQCVD
jgi:hypothetical protein